MDLDRISAANPATPLIARDALARQQWEAVIAGIEAPAEASAWPSRPVWTWSSWLRSCWEAAGTAGAVERNRFVLGPHQTDRLWRKVIDESDVGQTLVGTAGVAAWARAARRRLLDAGLAPDRQGGAVWQQDARVFLDWNRSFEDRLDRSDWIDPDAILFRLNRLPVEKVAHDAVLLDPPRRSAEAQRLVTLWTEAGFDVSSFTPDGGNAEIRKFIADDPRDELWRAADWVAQCLERDSAGLYSVVVPELDSRLDEIRTLFADRLGPGHVSATSSTPLAGISVCGAALNALRLLGPGADFDVLSRWLRSPYFVSDEAARQERSLLEVALRSEPRAQQDFVAAWQSHGLRDVVAVRHGDLVGQLDRALSQLPRRATPTTWTAVWQSCLRHLGWQGLERGLPATVQQAWDNAWGRFSELTPITGPMSMASALKDFLSIAAGEGVYEPLPRKGLLLASRIDQIGPGFAGAWITGFSDDSAHMSAAANPLLPWPVQAANRLPGASPEADLEAALEELNSLTARVPAIVFSCPSRVGEQPQTPSPLLRDWQRAAGQGGETTTHGGFAASRVAWRQWRLDDDPAPALAGNVIRGGTRTLDLQAVCPLKAFCSARLGAEPLEPPMRGIDPRMRGILIHRVLELLLAPDGEGDPESRVVPCTDAAFADLVRLGNRSWQTQVLAERARIGAIVRRFLEIEAGRAPFAVIAVEERSEIEIDGARLRCRIDRIDRALDGAELIIDYKTGRSAQNGWFEARLSDCQLPLYAQHVDAAGIAIIRLDAEGVEYRAAGTSAVVLPSGFRKLDEAGWKDQVSRWHEQIIGLVREFRAGDVRVRSDARDFVASDAREHAGGAFAPLSRIGDPS
jgi:probable DNA repair protein